MRGLHPLAGARIVAETNRNRGPRASPEPRRRTDPLNAMSLDQILIFIPAALLLGLSPGANNLLAFASAARAGWRRAALGVIGRVVAWAVLVVLVAFGLGAVLEASEAAFLVVKWLGVAYLAYLAVRFWNAPVEAEPALPPTGALMRREFLTLMGNPKAYLLLTAFLPQFVDPAAALTPQLLGLGLLYLLIEAVAAMSWVTLGMVVGAHALTPLRRRLVNRVSGGLLGLAAIALARTDRAQ